MQEKEGAASNWKGVQFEKQTHLMVSSMLRLTCSQIYNSCPSSRHEKTPIGSQKKIWLQIFEDYLKSNNHRKQTVRIYKDRARDIINHWVDNEDVIPYHIFSAQFPGKHPYIEDYLQKTTYTLPSQKQIVCAYLKVRVFSTCSQLFQSCSHQ